ncbi:MAG: DHH family phosphoesterase [Eubacterium sp.]|nr:DHH family phosphoesterase [Eubacterium sp.]
MKERLTSDARLYMIVFFVSVVLMYYNLPLGCLGILLCGLAYGLQVHQDQVSSQRLQRTIEKIYGDMDALNKERMYELPIAMAIVNEAGEIYWYNQYFDKSFRKGDGGCSFYRKKIQETLNLKLDSLLSQRENAFSYKDTEYTIVSNTFSDGNENLVLLHFFDVTIQKQQHEIYKRNEPVFCYILIDNYDDIIEQLPTHERSAVLSKIDLKLTEWAKDLGVFIIQYENDHYLMILEKEKLHKLEEERFAILDCIRETEFEGKTQVTLSIGIGISKEPLGIRQAEELSRSALDIALARGGDQAVVRQDEKMAFYGGATEATEKRTKVKARVKAHGLQELIKESSNVLIMGHKTPDMDCIGAAVGVLGACKAMGKPSKIVVKEINYSIKELFEYLMEDERYSDAFIKPKETEDYIDSGTLLIIVDTQNGEYLEVPELVDQVKQTVVIDHHRRSGSSIGKIVLNYTEAYASSTCELITELLQYFDEKDSMTEVEANALMAGMCMDTKMFTMKTGVRTFEAASYLRRKGADTIIAKTMLKDDFVTYNLRAAAVRNAKTYRNTIAISCIEDHSESAKVIAAQAADELLNIKGISASFILLKADEGIFISGRSLGEINVQLIMEKLGGGGHLAIAGAQLPDAQDLDEVKEMLLDAIDAYFAEREIEREQAAVQSKNTK